MAQNVNQFAQTAVLGQADLEFNGSVISAATSVNQATALVAGQFVKVENSVGGVPKVLALAAATDGVAGVVLRNLKDASFPASARLELGLEGTVVWLNSQGAIARWSNVEAVFATNGNVAASGGINPVVGFAFDEATAANQLIRVFLRTPVGVSGNSALKTINVTATLAQINAGLVIIPGISGRQITVTNFIERVVGAFASGTSVALQSDATSVVVETTAEAGLTNGAVLTAAPTANVTLGAGFGTALPAGEGLKVVNNGAAQTVGTSIQYTVSYAQQ